MKAINLTKQTAYIIEGQTLKLSGEVNVYSIGKLFKKNDSILQEQIKQVDCSYITAADSSFLALILYLKKHNSQLSISNLPDDLKSLMDLYDLDDLLNIA